MRFEMYNEYTLVRLITTGNIVVGKNNGGWKYGGLSEYCYAIYHVRTPKIYLAGFIMAGRNENMVKFPKNRQI